MFDVQCKKYNPFAAMQGDFYLGLSSLNSMINFLSGCSLQVLAALRAFRFHPAARRL
jgi:hypothetical protein